MSVSPSFPAPMTAIFFRASMNPPNQKVKAENRIKWLGTGARGGKMSQPMSILVVDDSEDSRLLIQRFLQEEGHREFLMAGSVPEALRLLAADAPPPPTPVELILMDLHLPAPDGIEGCRRISEDPRLRDIPV